jgi:hypothetical protein
MMKTDETKQCGICGGTHLNDLTQGRGEKRNIVCHDCGAHYWDEKWWRKSMFLEWVDGALKKGLLQ